jgi:hypothetical protein
MNWERSDRFEEWQGCRGCAHYQRARCIAYPDGIPLLLLSGEVDHMILRTNGLGRIRTDPTASADGTSRSGTARLTLASRCLAVGGSRRS